LTSINKSNQFKSGIIYPKKPMIKYKKAVIPPQTRA